jgi:hypothetical protein
MSQEYNFISFNPANIYPDLFLRPPTEVVSPEVQYIALKVAEKLTKKKKGDLRVGTELEVLFFSPDTDPAESRKLPDKKILTTMQSIRKRCSHYTHGSSRNTKQREKETTPKLADFQ